MMKKSFSNTKQITEGFILLLLICPMFAIISNTQGLDKNILYGGIILFSIVEMIRQFTYQIYVYVLFYAILIFYGFLFMIEPYL